MIKQESIDVTVAVMSYNNARFIGQTVESVLAQSGVSLELIVFDDCSTDDSVAVLQQYANDPRFRLEINPQNLGMMGNYNRCLDAGSGRYVVVLGSDDVIYPDHLASLFAALELHPESALAYTQCNWIDDDGKLVRYAEHPGHCPHSYFGHRDEIVNLLSHDNYITPSAVMLRRDAYPRFRLPGGTVHRPDLVAGDWELWTRIARQFPDFVFLHQPSVGYRVHGGQISQSFYGSEKPLAEHTEILELNLADPATRERMRAGAARIWGLYAQRASGYSEEVRAKYEARAAAIHQQLFGPATAAAQQVSLPGPNAPLFTIIITTYNRPQMLLDALASVAAQTCRDFELVLVNDCGEPVEHLLQQCDFPITYVRHDTNRGLSAGRNTALRLARGRHVCYLDDDDMMYPNHLEVLAAAIGQDPEVVYYTDSWYVNEEVLENGQRITGARAIPYPHNVFSIERLQVSNYIPVNTWCHPHRAFARVGGFDETLPALEDWEMLLRLAGNYPLVHLQTPTVEVRVRETEKDRMSLRQRKNFPALFRKIYERHGGVKSEQVRLAREQMLVDLETPANLEENPVSTLSGKVAPPAGEGDYGNWLAQQRLTSSEGRHFDLRMESWSLQPAIAVVVLDLLGNTRQVVETLNNAGDQLYKAASILIVSCNAAPPSADSERVHWIQAGDDWPARLNDAVRQSSADWLFLLHAGDQLEPAALLHLAEGINQYPELTCAYADEDTMQPAGGYGDPIYKPDFNLDLLRSMPYVGRAFAIQRQCLLDLGGWPVTLGEAGHLELLYRILEEKGLHTIGHLDHLLYHSLQPFGAWIAREDIAAAARAAASAHLQRMGISHEIQPGAAPGLQRVLYQHAVQPFVSIIIPTKDQLPMLRRCVETLMEKTAYPNYELIVVDNNSETPEAKRYLDNLVSLQSDRVRVLRYPHPFNFSAINNAAVHEARGDYLVLLNNDTAIVRPDWLDALLNHAQRPEVGIVGAKLYYPDSRVQHAGVVMGLRGPADHPFVGLPGDSPGYMYRLQLDQNYAAVTAACLMIRKAIYLAVGGMDEQDFKVSYNDVDLCLKVREQGYLTVWTPYSVVLHEGSVSQNSVDTAALKAKQKRFEGEQNVMYGKWWPVIGHDPAYNRNLLLSGNGFELERRSLLTHRPLSWNPAPRVLAHPGDTMGCGHYRMLQPFKAMEDALLIDGGISFELLPPYELAKFNPDAIILQRQNTEEQIEFIRLMREATPAFLVYELDDYLPNLPMKSAHREHLPKDVLKSMRKSLSLVDRFVVSTAPLAQAYSELSLHRDIRVVENRLPLGWWGNLPASERRAGNKPRVGWGGGISHTGDLELIADVVKELADEVEWVFLGMCPDKLRPYVHEFHAGVPIDQYPAKLASLNLDLALAPLEQNLFNECKSNLRLLEYGICGFPVVATDIVCYRSGLPGVTLVKNRFRDWVDAIRAHLADLDATAGLGDQLREAIRNDWMLQGKSLERWRQAWLPD
ncbi:glycosyltransferase [Chitiniphilus eburneus]|uniref:Glycosyltransferase n=1 Tax=Chitiniphilus eburneus TaxID=2571148 RepID=A0A4U0PZE5_9NEIS|nr:glycosyltransferase [Chitiniphilus eburneus]TJZ74041.1 glycosyltransferase [Chitiniphilus eburneus]